MLPFICTETMNVLYRTTTTTSTHIKREVTSPMKPPQSQQKKSVDSPIKFSSRNVMAGIFDGIKDDEQQQPKGKRKGTGSKDEGTKGKGKGKRGRVQGKGKDEAVKAKRKRATKKQMQQKEESAEEDEEAEAVVALDTMSSSEEEDAEDDQPLVEQARRHAIGTGAKKI
jgi:hypothetical protein